MKTLRQATAIILLGDGRADSFGSDGQPEATGTVKLEMDQTKATIHKQVPGYYGADGKVADAEKNVITKPPLTTGDYEYG